MKTSNNSCLEEFSQKVEELWHLTFDNVIELL